MPKHGKKYQEAIKLVDKNKVYEVNEAFELVKKASFAKFDETVELSIKTNLDPTKADQILRGAVVLPYGRGKTVRVLVIVRDPEKEKEAKEAGADYVGYSEYFEKIKEGWLDFDAVVATPDVMPELGKLGKILGPRGLMPSPKTGTVTNEIKQVVSELKKGRVEYKLDKSGNLHLPIGKSSFPSEYIYENVLAVFDEIIKNKPSGAKGSFIKSAYLSLTMSPSVKLSLNDIYRLVKERAR